ncbi:TPA: DEAD/DEAH box helicase family protein [Bacillus cereus]|nr:DEAD/DEAH box helicase family protein [Bacillus cereus]HDR4542725.1 DEAD/DEAH box helicase family protein [Bacillus cereus]HDR4843763.1 DEAD/DEAH box helicase family protein [Bacillus cereus]HDR4890150.1 DEAD/DEAH box helicase family protein [Bacillus cereus]HDR8081460.1 DEAD/DEAH box helicase family protein [Bacillus cereus]
MKIIPKIFQTEVIVNATTILSSCIDMLSKIKRDELYEQNRNLVISKKGHILFEAPTGTGKTLMASEVMNNLSRDFKVIWFWFAPFSGLVNQSIENLNNGFNFLKVKSLNDDRTANNIKSGDVYITTWANVAVNNKDTRKVRKNSETMLSFDDLINYARSQGYCIGTVIDEAHHSFSKDSQAQSFYREVLNPDITILATATPKDKEIQKFIECNNIEKVHKISVSRKQGVEARLIKKGVKVAVFKASENVTKLINFEKTALKCGVEAHSEIKGKLKEANIDITPLMLVQVDSKEQSIDQAKDWLIELGIAKEKIKVHTSDEPDPDLMSIAHNEEVEVLIFKMSVATGFDVPRAFTLVSMRSARDVNFGTQIVGRIMRVDKRMQNLEQYPEALDYGYVFLANKAFQGGLIEAAQNINSIRDELADITESIDLIVVEDELFEVHDGQINFFPIDHPNEDDNLNIEETEKIKDVGETYQLVFFPFLSSDADQSEESETILDSDTSQNDSSDGKEVPSVTNKENIDEVMGKSKSNEQNDGPSLDTKSPTLSSPSNPVLNSLGLGSDLPKKSNSADGYTYHLREDIDFPKNFKTATVTLDTNKVLNDVIKRFNFDEKVLAVTQQSATKILMEQIEVFANIHASLKEINADLAQVEIDNLAQKSLFDSNKDGMLDVRSLHEELAKRLKKAFENYGWQHMASDEKVREGLHKILALKPDALKKAVSEALANNIESELADTLPKMVGSLKALSPSRYNIYGIYPDDLNNWELSFVKYLDEDLEDIVKWWHRNPPRKPYSVCVPIPGQPNYYPDFIVGVNDRKKGEGILLIEIKRDINDQKENAQIKAQAVHPDYKAIMMLYLDGDRWMTVEFNSKIGKNELDRVFKLEFMQIY